MADDIVVNIAFKGNSSDFLAELSRQVGRAKAQLAELGQSTAVLSRLENTLARASASAGQFAGQATKAGSAVQGWSQKWVPFKGQFQEADAASKALWKNIDTGIASAEKSLARGVTAAENFQKAQSGKSMGAIQASPMQEWDKQFNALSKAADANTAKVQAAKRAIEDYQNSLSNARYVLYDVAGTLTVIGGALITPLAGAIAVAANFEKQFAQVARTTGVYGSELGKLKQEFDDLYGSIPITYEALAKIATLAGQLGVPAERVAAFTEVVAKTAAVTDLSVEQAATAFGRLDALIPNVRGQYDRLGSAIAKVGVNSVATESEIVNISTQISSMGSFAGLTAQDVIGLSGALASIGAQPELSRGTITRVFTLMSRAVNTGGAELNKFAKVSGVTGAEFAKSWGTDQFAGTFLKFMDGIRDQGGDAVATLNELGITSVRDVPLLLRLANAADSTGKAGKLLAQTIGDANEGWAENIELQRQYEIIAGTVAAKTEVLVNNFNLFLQALGGPMLEGLGGLIDLLAELTKRATDFVQSDIGGAIARTVVVLGALLGVLALAGGAMALMGASSIGVYQALVFLSAAAPKATAGILGTAGAAKLADGSLKAGAASALAFGRALRAISIIGALLLLPDILNAVNSEFLKMRGVDLSSAAGALREIAESADPLAAFFRTNGSIAQNFASDIANSFTGVGVTVKAANEALKQMASEGNFKGIAKDLNDFNKSATDIDAARVLALFPDVADAAKKAGVELKVVGDEIVVVGQKGKTASNGAEDMAASIDVAAEAATMATESLQEYKDALDAINGTQITAAEAADRLQSSINSGWEAIASGEATIDGTNTASITFRDSLREIESSARTAGEAILENGGSTEEATAAWQYGRDNITLLLENMGKTPAEAQAMADAMFGTRDQMLAAFRAITSGLQAVPSSKTITILADYGPAQNAINQFIWSNDGRRINLYVDSYAGRQVNGVGMVARAGGGPVFGRGTATSDSILAALSNGEFVIRTAAARAIGYNRLDHLNRYGKMPAFAGGGQVGSAPAPTMGGPMIVELSARDRALIANGRPVVLTIDGREIANTTNAANFTYAKTGKN